MLSTARTQECDDGVVAAPGSEGRGGLNSWGSFVVAAARIGRCRVLLTEDLQGSQDLDGLLVVDPFTHYPDSLSTPSGN